MNNIPAHRLSIVVPMYNEVDNVEPFVTAVHQALDKYPHEWELIIVNDGSRDSTREVAAVMAHKRHWTNKPSCVAPMFARFTCGVTSVRPQPCRPALTHRAAMSS